jgi:hypothetical protein
MFITIFAHLRSRHPTNLKIFTKRKLYYETACLATYVFFDILLY